MRPEAERRAKPSSRDGARGWSEKEPEHGARRVEEPEQEQELALEKVEAWWYESRRPAAWPLNGEASVRPG